MAGVRMSPEELAKYSERVPQRSLQAVPPATTQGRQFWDIHPVPAPRQSQRDAFKPKANVQRYRAFRDECTRKKIWSPTPGDLVVFFMRIPKSRRNEGLEGQPHTQVPDTDNLLKALLDACYADDAHIWTILPTRS